MKRVLPLLLFFIFSILSPLSVYSQEKLCDYPQVSFGEMDMDDTIIYYPLEIQGINVRVPKRAYDVFIHGSELSDREIINISDKTYMIDSLLYCNYSEYAGTYDFETLYIIEKQGHKYYVIDFFNAFQLGTMVQPCYMILNKDDGKIKLHSIYIQTDIEDNSGRIEKSVQVYFENDNICLKGINLEPLKKFDY